MIRILNALLICDDCSDEKMIMILYLLTVDSENVMPNKINLLFDCFCRKCAFSEACHQFRHVVCSVRSGQNSFGDALGVTLLHMETSLF